MVVFIGPLVVFFFMAYDVHVVGYKMNGHGKLYIKHKQLMKACSLRSCLVDAMALYASGNYVSKFVKPQLKRVTMIKSIRHLLSFYLCVSKL